MRRGPGRALGAWIGCVGVVIWQQIVRFGLAALLLRESAAFVLAFGREGDLGDVPFLSAVGAADRMGGWVVSGGDSGFPKTQSCGARKCCGSALMPDRFPTALLGVICCRLAVCRWSVA